MFLPIYEIFIDVSYLLGDSECFSGFDASLMDTDYAVRNIAKKTRWPTTVVSSLSFMPKFSTKEKSLAGQLPHQARH